jgi:tetratricopeptide (TPR) repeat protein
MQTARSGDAYQNEDDFNATNATIFESYRNRAWDEIVGLIEQSHAELLAQVKASDEDELNDPTRYAWIDGRPLWRNVIGNGFLHPVAHLRPEYIAAGDNERARQISLQEFNQASKMDDSPQWHAMLRYNLGCAFALLGDKPQALEHLEASLRISPELVEWAPQDGDLVSLHQDADFLALLQRMKI